MALPLQTRKVSENPSDSDSSSGWTALSQDGSDTEKVDSEHGTASDSCSLSPDYPSSEPPGAQGAQGEGRRNVTMSVGETAYPALEETKSVLQGEEEKSPADNVYFGTVSDNSDTVTLEPPKLEEIGNQGEAKIVTEAWRPEDFNVYILTASSCIFISV